MSGNVGIKSFMVRAIKNQSEISGSQLYINLSSTNIQSVSRQTVVSVDNGDVIYIQIAGDSTSIQLIGGNLPDPYPYSDVPSSAELIITRLF